MQLAELEFYDLSDLADALAVPVVTSILESSYDGIFNLLGIELPIATSWCFQDVDADSEQEQLQAQAFEDCQQNLQGRSIAILVLTTTSWPRIRQVTGEIQAAVAAITAGDYQELPIP